MEHELAGVGGKSIAMTSVGPGDGKTSTTLQIANAASQENRRILLIDADVRMRHLSERVDLAEVACDRHAETPRHGDAPGVGPGAATIRAEGLPRPARVDRQRHGPTGRLAPTDPGDPASADRAVDVRHAVRSIGDLFDLVLVDAPALLASSDALGVAGQADGVVLVVPHRVALSDLRDVRDRLAFVKTPLLGYVYVRPRGRGGRTLLGA